MIEEVRLRFTGANNGFDDAGFEVENLPFPIIAIIKYRWIALLACSETCFSCGK